VVARRNRNLLEKTVRGAMVVMISFQPSRIVNIMFLPGKDDGEGDNDVVKVGTGRLLLKCLSC
jgi:hypothetical protein